MSYVNEILNALFFCSKFIFFYCICKLCMFINPLYFIDCKSNYTFLSKRHDSYDSSITCKFMSLSMQLYFHWHFWFLIIGYPEHNRIFTILFLDATKFKSYSSKNVNFYAQSDLDFFMWNERFSVGLVIAN